MSNYKEIRKLQKEIRQHEDAITENTRKIKDLVEEMVKDEPCFKSIHLIRYPDSDVFDIRFIVEEKDYKKTDEQATRIYAFMAEIQDKVDAYLRVALCGSITGKDMRFYGEEDEQKT